MPQSQSHKNKAVVLSTTDALQNRIYMTQQTWDTKQARHPEVAAGGLEQIKEVAQHPIGYRHSTHEYAKDDTVAFEKPVPGTNKLVRLSVQYDSTEFLKGGTTGKITTIYFATTGTQPEHWGPLKPLTTNGDTEKAEGGD